MGKIQGVAYLSYKDQYALLNGETYTISFRLPGYVVKPASVSLLSNWPPLIEQFVAEMLVSEPPGHVVKPAPASLFRNWPTLMWQIAQRALRKVLSKGWKYSAEEYDPERWEIGQFVFVLERPGFFKVVTVLLGIVALISIFPLVWYTEPRQFLVNAVAYFLALWALRSVLSSGAPKVPTWVDYGALFLYLIEMAAVALTFALKRVL